jgi:hypothetical protein
MLASRKQLLSVLVAFLEDDLLEDVGHRLWAFTIPKMLRPYFIVTESFWGIRPGPLMRRFRR